MSSVLYKMRKCATDDRGKKEQGVAIVATAIKEVAGDGEADVPTFTPRLLVIPRGYQAAG